ncbi:MAG: diacylglycerol kinase family protein [Bacteroidales bacterium]|nr:diacylglycerol kinase family protein [Bacteroidales bacterium]
MSSDKHISIIINPYSGSGFSKRKYALLKRKLDEWKLNSKLHFIRKSNSPYEFIESELKTGSKLFVVIGGDGTVNSVAKSLLGKEAVLAIIPNGSGNGLARHLHISRNFSRSVSIIRSCKIAAIDYGVVNDHPFFCTSGVGFDAHVSHIFSKKRKRGFLTYLKVILAEFPGYKKEKYQISFEDKQFTVRAFLITMANASQFGNNAFISPAAKIDDGFLDLCIIRPFPVYYAPILGLEVLTKRITSSKLYNSARVTEVTIQRNGPGWAHIDGDPVFLPSKIKYKIVAKGLKVLVPEAK